MKAGEDEAAGYLRATGTGGAAGASVSGLAGSAASVVTSAAGGAAGMAINLFTGGAGVGAGSVLLEPAVGNPNFPEPARQNPHDIGGLSFDLALPIRFVLSA